MAIKIINIIELISKYHIQFLLYIVILLAW